MGAAGPLRVLHLTDPHLFADLSGELRGVVTYPSLESVLDHYRQRDWRADLILATGDIIQDDSAGGYAHFRELLGRVGLPVYCVPGNHDVRGLMQDALGAPPFHYCEHVEAGGWLIASIDSCVSGEVGGTVGKRELNGLDAAIAASSAPHVLVCLHHPPVPVHSRWLDSVGLTNGEEFLARAAASGRVRLVLFGHVHQEYDADHVGIRVLGTPSTCRQFARGRDEFAVDDNPPAYRRIDLYTDGRYEHELVWVRDEPVH